MELTLKSGLIVRFDDADAELISGHRWHGKTQPHRKTTYVYSDIGGATIAMHRFLVGLEIGDKRQVDHIDLDGLNNHRSNLRVCTHSQNQANRGPIRNGSSRFKGVTWHGASGKWMAAIRQNRKNIYLGIFQDEEAAARRYDIEAVKLFGEFARLNFPEAAAILTTPSCGAMP